MTTRRTRTRARARTGTLAAVALGATLVLVALGGFTRGSGSGYGCADRWPLCEDGAAGGLLPRADWHMVVEWTHRWVAAVVGLLILATAISGWRAYRRDRTVVVPAALALVLVLAQAYLGALVVRNELDADLVSLHLATALVVTALLTVVVVQVRRAEGRVKAWIGDRADGRRAWTLAAGAGATFVVLMLGSMVHDEYVGGWPLVGGELVPDLSTRVVALHFAHRVAAGLGLALVTAIAVVGRRTDRPRIEQVLVEVALGCYVLNTALGAAHVFTQVGSSSLVVGHLGVATLAWTCLVAATLLAAPVPASAAAHAAPLGVPGHEVR